MDFIQKNKLSIFIYKLMAENSSVKLNAQKHLTEKFLFSLLFVLAISIFILFARDLIDIRPFWVDEIFTFYHSNGGTWKDFIDQTSCGLNRMPPLYFLITKFLFDGDTFLYKCRWLSAFFSTISFLLSYRILRFWLARIYSFLISIITFFGSNLFIEYSIEARPYSMALMISVAFVYYVIKIEFKKKLLKSNSILLCVLCLLLPSTHYVYGLTALSVGTFHVIFSKHNRLLILTAYAIAGILFISIHWAVFIEQQNFGNMLMMIAYPSLEKSQEYLDVFAPTDVLLGIITIVASIIFFNDKMNFTEKEFENSKFLLGILIALFLSILIGISLARIFDESIWFLPRYFLSGILILPLLCIPLFHYFPKINKSTKCRNILIALSLFFIFLSLHSYKNKNLFLFQNPQQFCYSQTPNDSLRSTTRKIVTTDPVLFFHYIYEGVDIHYLSTDHNTACNFKKFIPDRKDSIIENIDSVSFIFIAVVDQTIPVNINEYSIDPLQQAEYSMDPLHRAYLVNKKL
jgi:hypothetical protein